jgi:uncharacterized SAM-binding protein YcdF (DUF218 family)
LFFVASKIFWMFASPIWLLLIAAFVGVLSSSGRHASMGRAVAAGAIILLAAAATPFIGQNLVAPLEDRFSQPPLGFPPPDGIIVLGSAVNDAISKARGQTVFAEGERIVQAATLAKRYPNARVIYTGGSGSLFPTVSTEALEARRVLTDLGVDAARVTLEDKSRNTEENARFTAALIRPKPSQRWLLVTSAYHMPRSMGVFEKAGFNVIAYPVAFRTVGRGHPLSWDFDPARNLLTFEIAAREWIGLAAYWGTGRVERLFPGPGGAEQANLSNPTVSPSFAPVRPPAYSAEGEPRR